MTLQQRRLICISYLSAVIFPFVFSFILFCSKDDLLKTHGKDGLKLQIYGWFFLILSMLTGLQNIAPSHLLHGDTIHYFYFFFAILCFLFSLLFLFALILRGILIWFEK